MKKLSDNDRKKMLDELRRRVIEKDKQLKQSSETEELLKANKEALLEMTELSKEEINRIEKSIEADFLAKRKRNRKSLIWTLSLFCLVVIAILLIILFSNDWKIKNIEEPESDQITVNDIYKTEVEKNWIYDTRYWAQEGDGIQYDGQVTDAVAWIDKKIENNVTITFDWVSDSEEVNKFELICILFGNGALKGNFWKDGIVLNYAVKSDQLNVSWIRINGIYADAVTLNDEREIPYFKPGQTYTSKIEYKDNLLSFYINEKPIQLNVLTEFENKSNYFGIAHYWDSKDKIKVSNVRILSE